MTDGKSRAKLINKLSEALQTQVFIAAQTARSRSRNWRARYGVRGSLQGLMRALLSVISDCERRPSSYRGSRACLLFEQASRLINSAKRGGE
jgi:hypothetical protein